MDACEVIKDLQKNRRQGFHSSTKTGKPQQEQNYKTWVLASGSGWKATSRIAWASSRFFIKQSQTKPERRFSAISIPIPTSIPITSSPYHPAFGWNASANP